MASDGFLYFISNPAFAGLLKVGMTTIDPRVRLQALDSTGLPTGFLLEMCFRVRAVRECESKVHRELSDCREKAEREFFRIDAPAALTRCHPILREYLYSGPSSQGAEVSARIPEVAERVLALIIDFHPGRRTYTYDVSGCLGISENEAIFQLGELKELSFIRPYSESKGIDYWIPLHKGLKYLRSHPIRWNEETL